MSETKTYKTKKGIYDISDTDIQAFLKDFPDAVETEAFTVGKDTFDIPITERELFLKDKPTAKPVKKKDISENGGFPSFDIPEINPKTSRKPLDEGITQQSPLIFDDAYSALTEANVTKSHKTGEPVTAENYITAAPQAYNKRMGEAIRNIAETISLPKNTLSYYINKFGGKNKETSQSLLEQAFSNIPLLGGVFDKEKVNTIASAIENAGNPKEIPQNVAGSVLSTLGSIAFDISTVRAMPTSKLNILAKHGMERVPVFPSYLGIMQGTTTAREGGNIKETGLATTEGLAAGLTYEGMGVTAGRVGKLVKDLGANNVTSTSARALANSALFEGDSRLKGGEKWTGAITGFVFAVPEYAGDAKRAIHESIAKRAYTSYLTTTDNAIKIISDMNINPKIERVKSDELWKQIEKETDPQKKQSLIEEKTTVDNIINVNAVSKAIIENPQPFIKEIQNDPRLSEKEKQQWTDKIGNTVRDADPRIKEAQPTIDKINGLTEQLNGLPSLYTEPTIRAEKAAVIEGQIKELRKGLTETLSRPLQDVPKYELNGKPIEKIDAMNMIAKAEKAEDLEGLKVSNDEEMQNSIRKRFRERVPQNDLAIGKDVFKNKAELFKHLDEVAVDKETGDINIDWFDKEQAELPNNETIQAIAEWTEKFKETKRKQAPQEESQPKTQSLYNKGQVIDMLLAEYPEDVRNEMRDEFAKEDNDKFTKMAAQAGFNSLGAGQYTFESVAKTSEQAPKEVKEPTVVTEESKTLAGEEKDFLQKIKDNIKDLPEQDFKDEEANANWNRMKAEREAMKSDDNALMSEIKKVIRGEKASQFVFEAMYQMPIPKIIKETAQSKEQTKLKEETQKGEEIRPIEPIIDTQSESDSNIPPKGDKSAEGTSEGEKGKVRKILERALNSDLPEDVKKELKEKGVEYVPRGRKVTEKGAAELVSVFDAEENGLDKLHATVKDLSNGILPDTRTMLNAMLAERYLGKLDGVTDAKERAVLRDKLTDALIFEAEQGTIGGQSVEAKKRWGRVFGTTPEIIVASMRERFDRENRTYFADKVTEVEFVKSTIEEYVKSGDFKSKIEQGIGEEIDKLGTKNWGKESKKKIDDFFTKLLIDPKQQNLYGGMLGIPVAMYNGSLLAIKNALLLGVDLATAIQRGVDYLDKEYKDRFEKGTIGSPDWGKDEYIADTNERLKALKQQIPTVEKPSKATKPKKVKAPPSQEELVDKLFVKMSKIATRKQMAKFVMDYMQEVADKGVITDPRFRAILAKALGRDYVTEQTEAKITKAARTLGSANKKAEEYAKSVQDILDEYQKEPKTDQEKSDQKQALRDLEKKAKEAKKVWDKSVFGAEKANQEIKEILIEQPDLLARMGTLIQGNLLVPGSQLANIYGNLLILPYTAPAYLVAGAADAMRAGGSSILEKALNKIDPIKYPDLYHWTNKHISSERTILPFEYAKGYAQGVLPSIWKGIKQLKTGALSSDLSKFDVQRGVHPIKALKDLVSRDRDWKSRIGDLFEAAPAGYFAEAQFRLLNIGDKPFRGGAESGRLRELFELDYRKKLKEAKAIEDATERKKRIKYLESSKNTARKRFMTQPESESIVEARKSGDIATFAQSSPLSEWISSFEKKFMAKDDNTTSSIGNGVARLIKMTNIPYVKIPINLTMLGIEVSCPPISAVKLLKHTYDGNTRAAMDDIGRLAISAALTSVAITFAKHGIITTLSDDRDVRAAQLEAGVEEGRFNISAARRLLKGENPAYQEGDKLRSIKRLGVVSIQMMSIAEAYKNKTQEDIAKMQENPFRSYIGSMMDALPYMPKIALEQSILMGANTLIQAALGGESEKDRWLTSQATVISTIAYPSTVAAISQATDPEGFLRETRDLSTDDGRIKRHIVNIFKDRMFQGKNLPAKVSLWGEPVLRIPEGEKWSYHLFGITKEKKYQKYSFGTHLYEIFKEYEKQDPEEAKKIFPTLPSYSTKVGWEDSKMTPFELQAYQMRVGTIRAQEAEAYINSPDWDEATLEEKNVELSRIYLKARKEAEAEMFSWEGFKATEPVKEHMKQWDIISNAEAVPLLSMVKTVKSGSKTYKLDTSDIKELNMIAFYKYAEKIIPYLEENKDKLDLLKEYNTRTGSSRFIDRTNDKWRESLDFAKRQMARQKRNEE